MGNYDIGAIRFSQSINDFPLLVSLDRKNPSWGLSRWKEKSNLRFIPSDDEGFTLRGNKHRLLYKGRRRSHRFTILNDGSFEYDCILLREPEINIITLRIEGAEQYDFFRQPNFVPDDFLKGSYAVYKKETFVGQGTGKLCHIHRPLIIDALGRKIWGELSVADNKLRITIPEWWLSTAKYPVTVDPTIGTTSIGSLTNGTDPNNSGYKKPYLDNEYLINKFLVPEKGNGQCTAYVYTYDEDSSWVLPFLYNHVNNKPHKRISKNEKEIDVQITGSKKTGWRNNTFNLNEDINSGNYIWFGIWSDWFTTRFDYGAECYKSWFPWDEYPDYEGEPTPYLDIGSWNTFCNIKYSMYFSYTGIPSQNYVRTLTQGVNLTDIRTLRSEYNRNLTQTTKITDTQVLKIDYKREALENVNGSASAKVLFTFFRQCLETVSNSIGFSRLPVFNRSINDNTSANLTVKNNRELYRNYDDVIGNSDNANRSQGFIRAITENIFNNDDFYLPVLFVRNVQDIQTLTDTFHQIRDFIRFLYVEAASMAETERSGDFFRTQSDTVNIDGFSFRHLLIFIKLVSTCFIRDFLLRRFLIAREELVLKSKITLELSIESKIN